MIEQQGVWSQLHVGAYVRSTIAGGPGRVWKVTAGKDGWFRIVDRDGEERSLEPQPADTPVTLMVPREEEAVENLIRGLDAEVMGIHQKGNCCWTVQPWRSSGQGCMSDARAHLKMFHGVYTEDVKSTTGLTEVHESDHANPDWHYMNAHNHPGGHHAHQSSR